MFISCASVRKVCASCYRKRSGVVLCRELKFTVYTVSRNTTVKRIRRECRENCFFLHISLTCLFLSLPPTLPLSFQQSQSPKESSKDVQLLLTKLIHLENENKRLREGISVENKQLQNENERLRSDLSNAEENLNLLSVRWFNSFVHLIAIFVEPELYFWYHAPDMHYYRE